MWNSEQLDLDAYLARIGYDGDRTPTLATLRGVQRAHVLNLHWDAIDSFLYREVRLDLASIQHKLLDRGRGGYCYEHTLLFAAALEKLGFRFTAVAGRIQLGADAGTLRPATHAMLITEVDGTRWLSDVGFGASPVEPIELADGARSDSGPWPYLLRRRDSGPVSPGWELHQRQADGWTVRQIFTEEPQYPVDYAVANHYVASNEHSPFVTRPYVQRLRSDRHDTLDGLAWRTERPGQEPVTETVEPTEVPKLLDDVFDIRVDATEAELIVERLTRRDPAPAAVADEARAR